MFYNVLKTVNVICVRACVSVYVCVLTVFIYFIECGCCYHLMVKNKDVYISVICVFTDIWL